MNKHRLMGGLGHHAGSPSLGGGGKAGLPSPTQEQLGGGGFNGLTRTRTSTFNGHSPTLSVIAPTPTSSSIILPDSHRQQRSPALSQPNTSCSRPTLGSSPSHTTSSTAYPPSSAEGGDTNNSLTSPSASLASSGWLGDEIDLGIERAVNELATSSALDLHAQGGALPSSSRTRVGSMTGRRALSEGSTFASSGVGGDRDGMGTATDEEEDGWTGIAMGGGEIEGLPMPSIGEIAKRPGNATCLDCGRASEFGFFCPSLSATKVSPEPDADAAPTLSRTSRQIPNGRRSPSTRLAWSASSASPAAGSTAPSAVTSPKSDRSISTTGPTNTSARPCRQGTPT
jgi:hypothetical protein